MQIQDKDMAQNEIDAYIEKRKADTENSDGAIIGNKSEESKEKDKELKDTVVKGIQTGATVVSAIPKFATLAIGAGAATLMPKILQELRNKAKK